MKQGGLHKLRGSKDGLSYFERNGEFFVRRASGFTAEQIKNDPKLARIKENNQEFTGAALAMKGSRQGLALVYKLYSDTGVSRRMMATCRAIIGRSTAVRGQRPFLPLANKDLLVGFALNEGHLLEEAFLAPYTIATNAGRSQVTLTVPDFDTRILVNAPGVATHFRLVCVCAVLSAYTYDTVTRQYIVADAASNGKNAFAASGYIALGGAVGAVTTVLAAIAPAPTLVATSALLACVGIEFYQDLGGTKYLLGGKVMRIKEVF